MKNNEEPNVEVKDLVDQFLDGTISDEGMAQLDRTLNESASLRAFFLHYCQMHIELGTDAVVDERAAKVFGAFCERKERISIAAEPAPSGPTRSSVPQPLRHFPFLTFGSDFGGTIWQPALVFTIGFLVAVIWYQMWLKPRGEQAGGSRGGAVDVGVTGSIDSPLTPVAYLTVVNGCNWGEATPRVWGVGQSVRRGDEIMLDEGIAEFRLASGVSLSIEGPTTLVMNSPNSLILQQGKLTTHVPWKAADFQILAGTNRLTAVDAEFGVQARGNSVSVHVFSGEVTATLSPYSVNGRTAISEEDLTRNADVKPLPITIRRSEAVELTSEPDGNTSVRHFTADQDQFASKISMSGQLPITSRYVEAVKKSKPIGYWRFESVENHEIRNEIPTGCPLRVTTELRLPGDKTNRVLESGYAYDKDNLMSTETMDAIAKGDFSLELWIKPSHYHRGILASVKDGDSLSKAPIEDLQAREPCYHFQLETLSDFGFKPGTLHCFIDTTFGDRSQQLHCFSDRSLYKLRRWQHIAIVRENSTMMLYVDAKKVSTAKGNSKPPLAEGQYLFVGSPPSFQGEAQFIGQLDELSIYDHALSMQEIKEHFEAVQDSTIKVDSKSEI